MHYLSLSDAVETIFTTMGGEVILGMPLGMGKPNPLANALYHRAAQDPDVSLTILTALSLARPHASTELQDRLLKPFVERVYGDYEELEYLRATRAGTLPDNIIVHEFFVAPASELNNAYTQQHYLNSNYTHVPRDMHNRKVNVIAQVVASREHDGHREISLSCNPEVILDLLPGIQERKAAGEQILVVGQVHSKLPFMVNSAIVDHEDIDILVEDPVYDSTLMNTPNMPVGMTEHFVGLAASALIKDGGTLQVGIGALGDAVASSVLLRHQDNASYRKLLQQCGYTVDHFPALKESGDLGSFKKGLYGCSEMVTYGLFSLFQAGVLTRTVQNPDGQQVCIHGGFYLGPNALYEGLRELSPKMLASIDMTNISFVNSLYGDEARKREDRIHARFINTAFSVTLLGAAIADQLEDGRMLSGVGGQYNFVAQAHELEGARSVLLVRATRMRDGEVSSNIVWNYGHTTIPRHLRDIVVTEYGVADLRSKTDAEIIEAMLAICDSRFQHELMEQAKEVGKLPPHYEIPEQYTNNYPARLQAIYREHHGQGRLVEFPLGSDFTYVEETLLKALEWLKAQIKPSGMMELVAASFIDDETQRHFAAHLERMGYSQADSVKDKLYRQLLLIALSKTAE